MLNEINQSQKTNTVRCHFCEVPRRVKIIEVGTVRGWEGGVGDLVFSEDRFQC